MSNYKEDCPNCGKYLEDCTCCIWCGKTKCFCCEKCGSMKTDCVCVRKADEVKKYWEY